MMEIYCLSDDPTGESSSFQTGTFSIALRPRLISLKFSLPLKGGNFLKHFMLEKYRKFLHYATKSALFFFGLLAPYLERACFLLATPAVSRVPLMMWYLVPGKLFNPTTTDKNNAVLLKVVSLSRNVACYLDSVGKTNSGDLSKSGVRF